MKNKKFYISTAIAYASAKPHIGNTYEIVLADVIARYKRLAGYDVYFQTGTDEHGQKIEEKAIAEGLTPQAYVDKNSGLIKDIWDVMNTSYDRFVRTTDSEHKKIVQKIFKKLQENLSNIKKVSAELDTIKGKNINRLKKVKFYQIIKKSLSLLRLFLYP